MNTYDLKVQAAVIAGGAQGIGLTGAARVAIWDSNLALAEQAAARLGCRACRVDVADDASVATAAAATRADPGPGTILVISAGVAGKNAKVMDYDPAEWDRIIAINLRGTLLSCRTILPMMVETGNGRIETIASVAGKESNPNASACSASKGAVVALTIRWARNMPGRTSPSPA